MPLHVCYDPVFLARRLLSYYSLSSVILRIIVLEEDEIVFLNIFPAKVQPNLLIHRNLEYCY